jgi:4'-phosphopantetheinyl transferase
MNISDNEIHLWCALDETIIDSNLLSLYFDLMSLEEQQQHSRFYFDKHKHQYLITRALVRSVLSLYDDSVAPKDWIFTKNKFGKPQIMAGVSARELCFNISHTDQLIVLAISLKNDIGVDVEYTARKGKMLDIAHSFFSLKEYEALSNLPPEQKNDRFFDLWTFKEAYIKACGMGLSIPLDHFSFSFSNDGDIDISFIPEREDEPACWKFWQIIPPSSHKIALAMKTDLVESDYSVVLREITPMSHISLVNYPTQYRKLCLLGRNL